MSDEGSTQADERGPVSAVPDDAVGIGDSASDAATSDDAASGDTPAAHATATCPVAWCPFCLAVGAVQPLRPDVVDHLLKAGTELLLAFRDVLDARADEVADETERGPSPTRLEKIDLG
jgi:hypothetical protein